LTETPPALRTVSRDVGPGEFIIVRRGVEHCPLALTDEVHVVLLEPKTTVNTGNVRKVKVLMLLAGEDGVAPGKRWG